MKIVIEEFGGALAYAVAGRDDRYFLPDSVPGSRDLEMCWVCQEKAGFIAWFQEKLRGCQICQEKGEGQVRERMGRADERNYGRVCRRSGGRNGSGFDFGDGV